jgi:hypothetical protein
MSCRKLARTHCPRGLTRTFVLRPFSLAMALSDIMMGEAPGGADSAFCAPLYATSTPASRCRPSSSQHAAAGAGCALACDNLEVGAHPTHQP